MSLAKANLKKLRHARYIPPNKKISRFYYVEKALSSPWIYRNRPTDKTELQLTHDTLLVIYGLAKSGLMNCSEESLNSEIKRVRKALTTGRFRWS
ncbi:TPA: hypothetical protein JLT73_004263 [Escherichia coli]|nr:hypothetical protein [Escherichia coli]HAW3648893.1 hypothetical protein [Escherichia coli]HDI9660945.1 hypothetical protein [Escherichia coli]